MSEGSAPERPGRRELKKLATREAIRAAAVRLAVAHGVEPVTVERIADEADVSLRTFFNHFSSKEEAVFAAAETRANELVAEFRRRPAQESVLQAVREAAVTVLGRADPLGDDHLVALRLIRRTPALLARQMVVLTTQERALAAAIADRLGPDPTEADHRYAMLCAATSLTALRIALDRWLDADGPAPERADALRAEIDAVLGDLGRGIDRPS
ncbi:TetR/AcrR family transcriptional regulator [Pseudonocardia nantongensis]|uniref:TetR/AcrR family transcriptional regulator n=1 Tax=Pseudonocardia nantongensis TaxID=1181885 RepID=UPI00397A4679